MRPRIKNLFILPSLITGFALLLNGQVTAQTFTVLHSFTATDPPTGTNSDGAYPRAALILSGHTLYGTAGGSTNGTGSVFAINTNGTGFTTLYSFTATDSNAGTNSDGAGPNGLILSGNTLYGTAVVGGTNGAGTVFAVKTNGTGFTILHCFTALVPQFSGPPCCNYAPPPTNSDGANPEAALVLSGDTLYGTAYAGGTNGYGAVFAVKTNGTGFTLLHTFTAAAIDFGTNVDGANPNAGLVLMGNTLYGTGSRGGTNANGTVFAIKTNGTSFAILHTFTATDLNTGSTNSDGAIPYAGLVLSGNTLFGTTYIGGTNDSGTVFAVNTNGTGFTTLHNFAVCHFTNSFGFRTNSDGANPYATLILSGNTLYGTAFAGGTNGSGAAFAINTNGSAFTTLHSFGRVIRDADPSSASYQNYTNNEGVWPQSGLLLAGNRFFGTASGGGLNGNGTVFSLSFTPSLAISHTGTNVILTWPTNVAGFNYTGYALQSTTNLLSPADWSAVSPTPVVVNGQQTVTNSIFGTRKFYRLTQ